MVAQRKLSYCEDCVHRKVCKFTKDVQEYEAKQPALNTAVGPVISFSVLCESKLTWEGIEDELRH